MVNQVDKPSELQSTIDSLGFIKNPLLRKWIQWRAEESSLRNEKVVTPGEIMEEILYIRATDHGRLRLCETREEEKRHWEEKEKLALRIQGRL